MTRPISRCLPTLAAFALLTAGSTVVSAQTVPQQADQSGATVREILSRAETESRRRSIGDILGGIAGISRAEAQAAPATTSSAPVSANGSQGQIAIAQSTAAPRAAPPVPSAGTPAVSSSRPSTNGSSGTGTPADPTMIVTVPDNLPARSSGGVTETADGATEAPAAAAAAAAAEPSRVAPAISTPDGAERRGSIVVAASQPRHAVRTYGYGPGRDWCPPGRW
jgi:hypothetical protein